MQKSPKLYRVIDEVISEAKKPSVYHTVFTFENDKWSHWADRDTKDDAKEDKESLVNSGLKSRHVKILKTPKTIRHWGKGGVDPHEYVTSVLNGKLTESQMEQDIIRGIKNFVARRKESRRITKMEAYHRKTPLMQRDVKVKYHEGDGVFYGKVHGKMIEPSSPRELRHHLIQNHRYPPEDAEALVQHHMKNSVIGQKHVDATPALAGPNHERIVHHLERWVNLASELEHTPEHEKLSVKGVPVHKRSLIMDNMRHHASEAAKHGFDHKNDEHVDRYSAMVEKKIRGEPYLPEESK